jgi:hypothetical protein
MRKVKIILPLILVLIVGYVIFLVKTANDNMEASVAASVVEYSLTTDIETLIEETLVNISTQEKLRLAKKLETKKEVYSITIESIRTRKKIESLLREFYVLKKKYERESYTEGYKKELNSLLEKVKEFDKSR